MSVLAIRSSHVHIIHTGSLCKDKLSTIYKNRAHAKRKASVIFSVLISHTLEPHALPGKKWRWGELILLHWIVFYKMHKSTRTSPRIVFALLSLSALGHGKALRDPAVDEYIAAILELLKTQMPTGGFRTCFLVLRDCQFSGIPDLGIPPLDPFEVPHFDIDPIE